MKYQGYIVYSIPVLIEAEDEGSAEAILAESKPDFSKAGYEGALLCGKDEALLLETQGNQLNAFYQ